MTTLFLISLAGYAVIRRRIVDDSGVSAMTRLLVDLIVPAKLATAMMEGLDRRTISQCATIIFVMVVWTLWTLGAGALLTFLWKGGNPRRDRAIWALCGMQNGIYLPLPLVLALVPPEMRTTATVYVGGAVLVLSMTQWSLGVALIRSRPPGTTRALFQTLRETFNPPILGIVAGSLLSFVPVFAAAAKGEPAPIWLVLPMRAAQALGETLGPIAMLVLGMLIGQCQLKGVLGFRTLGIPILVRLILSPLVMLLALAAGPLAWVPGLVGLVLIVEGASPPATNLSLMARRFDGDWEQVVSSLLVTYLLALITVPVFTSLYLAQGRM